MPSDKLDIVLASGSPRRQQLLREMGFEFATIKTDVDETYPSDLDVSKVPAYLAEKKARQARQQVTTNQVLITADTVVILEGKILGKPGNREEAMAHLRELSGKPHTVASGVSVIQGKEEVVFTDYTRVHFKTLTNEMIQHYVDTCQPFDKAGAYAIQEWIGLVGIEKIEGSYFNVVGLPVHKLYEVLMHL